MRLTSNHDDNGATIRVLFAEFRIADLVSRRTAAAAAALECMDRKCERQQSARREEGQVMNWD